MVERHKSTIFLPGDVGPVVFPVQKATARASQSFCPPQSGWVQPCPSGEVAAGGPVGGAFGRVDADEPALQVGHDLDVGVATQVAGDVVGHDRAQLELPRPEGSVGVDVAVEHHHVAFAALSGAPQRRVQGIGGF